MRAPSRSWRFSAALASTLALWAALRVLFWNGYYVEDAPGYVTDALYVALGNYHARHYITGLNIGTYVPVALPLALFGKSEAALGLWPLFCSLLGLASSIGAAGLLFGRRSAVLAGILYATYPGDVFFSTVVMPDAIQAGWLSLSVFLVVLAYAAPPPRRTLALAAAGIGLGICTLVRGNGPILLPVGIGAVIILARRWRAEGWSVVSRNALVYLTSWALVLAAEGLVYFWATADLLHRVHVVNRHYGSLQSIAQWGLNTNPQTIPFSIFPPLLWWRVGSWGSLNHEQAYHGILFCLAFLGILLAAPLVKFSRGIPSRAAAAFVLAVLWLVWPLAYHQFGSQSLTGFVPIHRLSRHLVVYAPGAVFAVVASVSVIGAAISAWGFARVRRAAQGTGLVLLGVHLVFAWQGERTAWDEFHRIKDTYVRIHAHLPEGVHDIVGDPGDLGFLDFWLNPPGVKRVRLSPFADYSRCDELSYAVVLTRSNPGWNGMSAQAIRDAVNRLPCLVRPPPQWRLLYGGFPEKVYVVEGTLRTR